MKLNEFSSRVAQALPSMHLALVKSQPSFLSNTHLTMPQLMFMETLRILGPSKMSDLSKTLGVTKSAVTGIADRLIKSRYLTRSSTKTDRRVIMLDLTTRGKVLSQRMARHRLQMIRDLFKDIREKDRTKYLDILAKIKENIDRKARDL